MASGPRLETRYRVAFDTARGVARVRACFPSVSPRWLRPVAGGPRLLGAVRDGAGRALPRVGRRFRADGLSAGGCVNYAVALGEGLFERRTPDAALTSPDRLLLRPDAPTAASLSLVLGPGDSALTPWGDEGRPLPSSALEAPGHLAVGRLRVARATGEGLGMAVALLPGELALGPEGALDALRRAATTVSTVYGRLPTRRLTAYIVPAEGVSAALSSGAEPAPVVFGLARRGGGASVMLLVSPWARADGVADHWVLPHELSHLLLPPVARADAWFSEGVATYYQEVARVRAGVEGEAQAWRRFVDGFARGAADGRGSDATLAEEAAQMRETGRFRRVYWSGVVFALRLDLELRSRPAPSSLDALLCASAGAWSGVAVGVPAREVAARFDALLGDHAASRAVARAAAGRGFPDPTPELRRLGVGVDPSGRVVLDDAAPDAALRRAIMAPRDPRRASVVVREEAASLSGGSCR